MVIALITKSVYGPEGLVEKGNGPTQKTGYILFKEKTLNISKSLVSTPAPLPGQVYIELRLRRGVLTFNSLAVQPAPNPIRHPRVFTDGKHITLDFTCGEEQPTPKPIYQRFPLWKHEFPSETSALAYCKEQLGVASLAESQKIPGDAAGDLVAYFSISLPTNSDIFAFTLPNPTQPPTTL